MLDQFLLSQFQENNNSKESLSDTDRCIIEKSRQLRKWEQNLHKRELSLRKKTAEQERNRKDQRLNYQKTRFYSNILDAKKNELKKQHLASDAAVQRFYRERELWQKEYNSCMQEELENQISQLHGDFTMIRGSLDATQQKLVHLMELIQSVQDTGIEELCWLYRDIAATNEEASQHLAARLAVILREFFSAVPIEPGPGEIFDSRLCERQTGTGNIITACLHRGWKWVGGTVRAIVAVKNEL